MNPLFYAFPVLAFFLGSIPFGLFIARSKGINIREVGSGNIGATNVFRTVGKKEGITCFFLDVAKGALPVLLIINVLGIEGKSPLNQFAFLEGIRTYLPSDKQTLVQALHVITGFCAIMGHNYSPWIGFKGGKGIATSAGVIAALMPIGLLIMMVLWAVVTFSTRYVALGSIVAAGSFPAVVFWGANHHHVNNDPAQPSLWEAGTYNKPLLVLALVSATLAIWKHRSNIQRLLKGTENRFGKKP